MVDGEIFCVHAGLSPSFSRISQINLIDRVAEIPHEGIFCDLMWSEPEEIKGWGLIPKGCGYSFGADVIADVTLILVIFI